VRASFAVTSEQLRDSGEPLDRAAAAAFGLLGILDGPELGLAVAARLLDQPEETAERVLERLVDAQLLETPAAGRYRMHDLPRLYAREQAAARFSAAECAAALTRAFGLYAATAWRTLALLRPGDHRLVRADDRWRRGGIELPESAAALAWSDTERPNLLAAVEQAATTPGVPEALAVQLAHSLFGVFNTRGHWRDQVWVNQVALEAARRMGDRAGEAQTHNDLGCAHQMEGRYEDAVACHLRSLAIRRELGDRRGQAASLGNLGLVYEWQGRYDEALDCHQESLTIYHEQGDRRGQSTSLSNLGGIHQLQGQFERAVACHQMSLTIDRELGDRRGQALSLGNLGVAHEQQGDDDRALARLHEAMAIIREVGDRRSEAECLRYLGGIHGRHGRYDQALSCLRESVVVHRELGNPHGQAESLRELGTTLRALGDDATARTH
jgi:tetratricopeptide (TPR) repeat protein